MQFETKQFKVVFWKL